MPKIINSFIPKDIQGNDLPLNNFVGQVLLIVNVASKCGFTPQYEGLESLYQKYKEKGLVVLGFPANNFLWQEPGSNKDIQTFCTTRYQVTFPMFAKISVKGKKIDPLYQFLTGEVTEPVGPGGISWNFNKFLVNRAGEVIYRFGSRMDPLDDRFIAAIEGLLE